MGALWKQPPISLSAETLKVELYSLQEFEVHSNLNIQYFRALPKVLNIETSCKSKQA